MNSKHLVFAVFGWAFASAGVGSATSVHCQTVSGTEIFRGEGKDLSTALQQAKVRCEEAASTSNSQCELNIACTDPEVPQALGPITCQATSSGFVFVAREMTEAFAVQSVKAACQADPVTSNAECESSVLCDQGTGSLHAICQIKKGHVDLQRAGRTIEMAQQAVMAACQAERTLTKYDCLAKVQCSVQATSDEVTTQPPPVTETSDGDLKDFRMSQCFVRPLDQIVKWPEFFSFAESEAQTKSRCVYAKVSDHPESGRIYLADGTKLASELSSSRARDAMRLAGLTDCEALTCDSAISK